jgi:hypothetical protein
MITLASQLFMAVVAASSARAATPPTDFGCLDLRKAAQKMSVHAVNIANRSTTRTPEGGAFKRVEISCKDLYCETEKKSDFRMVYEPTHPDANKAGYVQYPSIDVSREFAAVNTASAEIRLLAGKEVCGAKAIISAASALVKYDSGSAIQSDTFNFSTEGRLTSWSRILRDGTTEHYSFSTDGALSAKSN